MWATRDGDHLGPRSLLARQAGSSNNRPSVVLIVIIVVAVVFVLGFVISFIVRKQNKSAKGKYERTAGDDGRADANNTTSHQASNSRNPGALPIDRSTSVRSIMTLPAYRPRASDGERILGREGERDGVDVIVEHSTAAEEEAMREEEMETLYQIRMARRRELAEREARREERNRARDAGDVVALSEIRARHAREREVSALPELREVHSQLKEKRQRAVSSVSYHDLGVARADGSRLRANSTESEQRGLLSDAASIGGSSTRPHHTRERSASSIMSFDSMTDVPSPGLSPSGATTPRLSMARSVSNPDAHGVDLGDVGMLGLAPPDYEDVQLSDNDSRSPTPTYQGPPPQYPGDEHTISDRRHSSGASMGDQQSADASHRSSRGVGCVPQLPSLRIARLPEIVIEPSTAVPPSAHQ